MRGNDAIASRSYIVFLRRVINTMKVEPQEASLRIGTDTSPRYLILFLGADWWGSDARALAVALRQLGHSLIELNYEDYLPTHWSSFPLRVVRRLIRPLCAQNFNRAVKQHAASSVVDFVLAFKGMLLEPATLHELRGRAIRSYCFYPDVSFADHGENIAGCLPLYDCVFTTKRFHANDPVLRAKTKAVELVRHGFDPVVHRQVAVSPAALRHYGCDVSFVGCWSPKKESLFGAIIAAMPDLTVRIWGPGWGRAEEGVRATWQKRGAYGDELAIIYNSSKINLGLLSEAGSDTAAGDEVTARTWQIPASGGFLLHERTQELGDYLNVGEELGTFEGRADIADQVCYYLENPEERMRVATAGLRRCQNSGYTYAEAAKMICEYHAVSKSS